MNHQATTKMEETQQRLKSNGGGAVKKTKLENKLPQRSSLEHAILCEAAPKAECLVCMELREQLLEHARSCDLIGCSVPFCLSIKQERHPPPPETEVLTQTKTLAETPQPTTSSSSSSSSSGGVEKLVVITMSGHFDGMRNYSGQWFDDNGPNQKSSFVYAFREDDVTDPDDTIPCFVCKKACTLFLSACVI